MLCMINKKTWEEFSLPNKFWAIMQKEKFKGIQNFSGEETRQILISLFCLVIFVIWELFQVL